MCIFWTSAPKIHFRRKKWTLGYVPIQLWYRSRYSRIDQIKFIKVCLPQILLGPFLNTLTHFTFSNSSRRVFRILLNIKDESFCEKPLAIFIKRVHLRCLTTRFWICLCQSVLNVCKIFKKKIGLSRTTAILKTFLINKNVDSEMVIKLNNTF